MQDTDKDSGQRIPLAEEQLKSAVATMMTRRATLAKDYIGKLDVAKPDQLAIINKIGGGLTPPATAAAAKAAILKRIDDDMKTGATAFDPFAEKLKEAANKDF